MYMETTIPTEEIGTVTVPIEGMSADGAFLRGVPGFYEDHPLSEGFGFVPEELFQLVETPIVQFPVLFGSTPLLHAYLAKIFDGEHRIAGINNSLGYTVVHVGHKPSFPSANPLEFTASGSGAFGLKFCSKLLVVCPDVLHDLAIKERVIRAHGDVIDSPVYTEDFDFIDDGRAGRLDGYVKAELLRRATIGYRGTLDIPTEVRLVAVGNVEGCFDPASNGGERSDTMEHVHRCHAMIVPHGREWLSLWNCLALDGFEGFAGAVPSPLDEAGREIAGFPDDPVRCLVVLHLVPAMAIEAPLGGVVEGLRIFPHRFEELRSILFGQSELEGQATHHIHIITLMEEIVFGGIAC